MIELVLHNPNCKIGSLPDGKRALILTDEESGILVTTAIAEEVAKKMGDALIGTGTIKVASLDDLGRRGGDDA